MPNVEVRLFMEGKELSLGSFVEAFSREVRVAVREEMNVGVTRKEQQTREQFRAGLPEAPRQAVSKKEAARLLSISVRTVENYIALKMIRTVRIGRRVLIPMKVVNDLASKGIRQVEPAPFGEMQMD